MHTPGTWKVAKDNPWYVENDEGDLLIASIKGGAGKIQCMAESDANARLIAAAPELLEACNIWIEYFDHFLNDPKAGSDEDNLLEMRKAIAKAEGKEETNEVRTEQV